MLSLREMKNRDYMPNSTYIKMLAGGGFSLAKVMLTNLGDIKKLSESPQEEKKYIRPQRRYNLPQYKVGMKFYNQDEKFLRPTLWCNSHSKKIIALANKLGAFEKSDRDFAEAAFEWTKRNLVLEILPMNEINATLKRGTGTCIHINNVFAALCRCAGIKTRYKMFAAVESQSMYEEVYDDMMRKWYDALGYFSLEADIEVLIDDKWVVAHAGPTPERQAGMGIPITRLGEESIGLWFDAIPGTMFRTESIPYGIGLTMKIMKKIAPSSLNTINLNITNQIEKGKKILEEKGGEKKYDEYARKLASFKKPEVKLKDHKSIVFED